MEKIKHPSVAGKFYTAEKKELEEQIEEFINNSNQDYEYKSRAVIVPHAGYAYSGQLAVDGLMQLDKNVKNIFVFALSHFTPVTSLALTSFDKWATPLGEILINQEINKTIINEFGVDFNDEAFENEHSAEVQIPLIQSIFKDVKVIPLLISNANPRLVSNIIEHFWNNKENAFVISSDLSHFYNQKEAVRMDLVTAEMIETNLVEDFHHLQACNSKSVMGLINFAKNKNYSLVRISMKTSADTTGDESSVVGYGSWMLYEGEKNEFIKKYFSQYCIEVCRNSINYTLQHNRILPYEFLGHIPSVLKETGACFITLEKHAELRGCVGSIIGQRPLILDLIQNSYNSAFSDPRFLPINDDEFKQTSISISLLSSPQKIEFKDEKELLDKIIPFKDGIIIKEGSYQAVYLPSVWEQLPVKTDFLNSLKIKAGLNANYFSKTFEAYKFKTDYIEEAK